MSYGFYRDGHVLDNLVGRSITAIHWAEDTVVFDTDAGPLAYEVEGDCCSYSYFHDFFGVEHLLNNGPVTAVADVELADDDPRFKVPAGAAPYDESVVVYGYQLTTVHPTFGEVTSVLSFRNSSNGYYGGWMDRVDRDFVISPKAKLLTTDFTGE